MCNRWCKSLDTERELDSNIDVASQLDDLGELDRLLSGVLEILNGEDLKTRVVDLRWVLVKRTSSMLCDVTTYQLPSLLHVGSLQTSNDGGTDTHFRNNVDQTLSDGIAADDTTEDVNEDGSDLGITGDKLEGGADGSRSGTTTDVQEVSRVASVQLDDIHGGHGETSTIDCINISIIA